VWFLLSFTVVTASTAYSQLYTFDHYTSKEGLLSDYVLAVCSDSRGYIWVGTNDGLSQYNGESFKNFTVADGLAFSRITCLIESTTEPGALWIGTNGGGISKFRDNKFTTFRLGKSLQSNMISSLFEDRDGTLWCGTIDGLYRLNGDTISRIHAKTFSAPINNVARSADGSLWIGADKLYVIPAGSETPEEAPIRINHNVSIDFIHPGSDSTVWVGLSNGQLIQSRRGNVVRQLFFKSAGFNFMIDDNQSYLIGAAGGIYRLQRDGSHAFLCYSTANGLPENFVPSAAVDREGNIWFGLGTKGVAKLSNTSIMTLPIHDMPFAPNGTSAAVDNNDHLWTISAAGVWEIWHDAHENWKQVLHKELPRDIGHPPFSLLFVPPSSLWIGFNEGPIKCYRIEPKLHFPSSLRLIRRWDKRREFPGGDVLFMYMDREGYLWASMTGNRGVYLFDPRRKKPLVRTYTTANGLPDNSVRAMIEDRYGNFWFGGYDNGLTRFTANQKFTGGGRRFTTEDSLPNMSIRALGEDNEGTLWIGTRYGGLAYYRDSVFHPVSLKNGLASTAVWALSNGKNGHWVGTQLGFQEILSGEPISFSSKRELLARPVYACGEIDSGWLWSVTTDGIMLYDRADDLPDTVPPPIYITNVMVNGVQVDLRGDLEFPFDRNSFTIDVVGLSFKDEKAVRYQYKLSGNDQEWSAPTDHQSIIFAALAPGKYTFMARAINEGGVRSTEPAEFSFSIDPPLWRTWWFLSFSIFVIAGLILAFIRVRVQRLLEIERIRSRIATDLHDDIGAGLTRIAILSSVAERERLGSSRSSRRHDKTQDSLKKIGDTARELVDAMSDVVWSLEAKNDSLEGLVHRLRSFAFEACEAKNISLAFEVDNKVFNLQFSAERMRNLLLCAKEAITNLVRHSHCTSAKVRIDLEAYEVVIEVMDDGSGFNPEGEDEGHGLRNMENRAKSAGGKFSLVSSKGKGTRIRATFPLQ